MKKMFLAALSASALLALGACTDDAADTNDDEVLTAEETTVINETPDPVVVGEPAATEGDSFSASEDGVSADVNNGNTSVSADIDEDPSLEVETD